MMRSAITIVTILLCACMKAGAQQPYTQRLKANPLITLHQSSRITDLVNGSVRTADETTPTTQTATDESQVIADYDNTSSRQRIKMNGYRIQVYAGGNSRQNKQQAENAAARVRSILAGESVYTNFVSPRWVCRVGNYRSYEEAYNALRTLKEAGGYGDAVIVKSKVQVYID